MHLPKNLKNKWALITGASSGFGVDYAHILAKEGMNLVITARRTERLEKLKNYIERQHPVKVEIITSDLGIPNAGLKLKEVLNEKEIQIDVLVNNAGYGLHGDFQETELNKTLSMLQVDVIALTELTKIFVDKMKQRDIGYILLVGSLGGYQPTPTYAAYAAAKSYVLNFGEALNYELRNTNVNVSVINPGVTNTEFLDVSGQEPTLYQKMAMMNSYPVAMTALKGMFNNTPSIVPGLINKLTVIFTKMMPRSIQTRAASYLMSSE